MPKVPKKSQPPLVVSSWTEIEARAEEGEKERTKVRIDRDGWVSFRSPRGFAPYEFELERVNTPSKLLEWVYHLSDKVWFDSIVAKRLIELVSMHFGFPLFDGTLCFLYAEPGHDETGKAPRRVFGGIRWGVKPQVPKLSRNQRRERPKCRAMIQEALDHLALEGSPASLGEMVEFMEDEPHRFSEGLRLQAAKMLREGEIAGDDPRLKENGEG